MSTPVLLSAFSKELDISYCYESRGYQEALARLSLMVDNRYLGVLTGEVGGGKSTLIRRLFADLNDMTHAPVYICKAGLKPRDFYGAMLTHMGMEPCYNVGKARQQWEEALHTRTAQGERMLVVVVDEAHEMSEAMFSELRFILNHNMDSCSLFPLLLVGQPELRKTLRLKKYEATAQRIGMQYHLNAMTKEETYSYIRHHMKVAGQEKPVFAEGALQRIYSASQGLPRVTNQICTQALLEAGHKDMDVMEEAQIIRVLADMDRQRGLTGTVS